MHPTAEWIIHQITDAFPWNEAPRYLIRDRDQVYGTAERRRLRTMGIRDKPIAPRSPWQNGVVERMIGSIRRECTDHIIALGEAHLRRVLKSEQGLAGLTPRSSHGTPHIPSGSWRIAPPTFPNLSFRYYRQPRTHLRLKIKETKRIPMQPFWVFDSNKGHGPRFSTAKPADGHFAPERR